MWPAPAKKFLLPLPNKPTAQRRRKTRPRKLLPGCRRWPQRTIKATKEIAQMIRTVQDDTKVVVVAMEEGTRQVEEGVTTTSRAGDSLKQIIHMSKQVGEMITHIATAATEQSSATEEINTN